MTPEEEARQVIDELLKAAGWEIQDYKDLNPGVGQGVIFSCPAFSGRYIQLTRAEALRRRD